MSNAVVEAGTVNFTRGSFEFLTMLPWVSGSNPVSLDLIAEYEPELAESFKAFLASVESAIDYTDVTTVVVNQNGTAVYSPAIFQSQEDPEQIVIKFGSNVLPITQITDTVKNRTTVKAFELGSLVGRLSHADRKYLDDKGVEQTTQDPLLVFTDFDSETDFVVSMIGGELPTKDGTGTRRANKSDIEKAMLYSGSIASMLKPLGKGGGGYASLISLAYDPNSPDGKAVSPLDFPVTGIEERVKKDGGTFWVLHLDPRYLPSQMYDPKHTAKDGSKGLAEVTGAHTFFPVGSQAKASKKLIENPGCRRMLESALKTGNAVTLRVYGYKAWTNGNYIFEHDLLIAPPNPGFLVKQDAALPPAPVQEPVTVSVTAQTVTEDEFLAADDDDF